MGIGPSPIRRPSHRLRMRLAPGCDPQSNGHCRSDAGALNALARLSLGALKAPRQPLTHPTPRLITATRARARAATQWFPVSEVSAARKTRFPAFCDPRPLRDPRRTQPVSQRPAVGGRPFSSIYRLLRQPHTVHEREDFDVCGIEVMRSASGAIHSRTMSSRPEC